MIIRLEAIDKSFGEKKVLKNYSAALPQKGCAFMGKSGCGKTTLLHLIAGLLTPDAGNIHVQGKMSMVFQEDRLLDHCSALENITFVNNDKATAAALLAGLGLKNETQQPAGALSGGMRRRLAIARALSAGFDAILLDEAFKGLDSETKLQALQFCRDTIGGRTIILASHNIEEARFFGLDIRYLA